MAQVKTLYNVAKEVQDNIAQVKPLWNVVQEALDNIAQKKSCPMLS